MSLLPPLWRLTMEYLEVGEQNYIESIQCGIIAESAIRYVIENNITQWILDMLTNYPVGKQVQMVSITYDNIDSFMASMTYYENNFDMISRYKAGKIALFIFECDILMDDYDRLQLGIAICPIMDGFAYA